MNTSAAATEGPVPRAREEGWFARILRWDWETIRLVLAIKLLFLTFGIQAVAAFTQKHRGWLELWNNWDSTHYLKLAEHGYVAAGDSWVSLVFFPLYPWLVRLVAFVARDYMLAALIVSGFASFAAATNATNGLPSTVVYDMVFNPNETLIFTATEAGPYVYVVSSNLWYPLAGTATPAIGYIACDYNVLKNKVHFGTFGRGIWDFNITSQP